VFDKFATELREALKSLTGSIELDNYDEAYENDAKTVGGAGGNRAGNQNMLMSFEATFRGWIQKIDDHLEKKDEVIASGSNADLGPRSELELWRKKMRKLTCISEQLRSQKCKTVYNALMQASQHPGDQAPGGKSRDQIHMLTSQWRGLELKVTESLNEAKDNVKYLTTLEKFIEPLYEGTPETIKDTLPALMNSIKMIHTIARYYNTNDKMTGLFIKITTQMI
jgi:dynein heavy chain